MQKYHNGQNEKRDQNGVKNSKITEPNIKKRSITFDSFLRIESNEYKNFTILDRTNLWSKNL